MAGAVPVGPAKCRCGDRRPTASERGGFSPEPGSHCSAPLSGACPSPAPPRPALAFPCAERPGPDDERLASHCGKCSLLGGEAIGQLKQPIRQDYETRQDTRPATPLNPGRLGPVPFHSRPGPQAPLGALDSYPLLSPPGTPKW